MAKKPGRREKKDAYHSRVPVDLIGSVVAVIVLLYLLMRRILPF